MQFRRTQKFLASLPPASVHIHPLTDNMDKKTLVRIFLDEAAPHLRPERRAELVELFSAAIDPDTPMAYKDRPAGEDFVTWWAREYGDRGLIGGLSYRKLLRIDVQAARAYEAARDRGDIPARLQMAKARSGPPCKSKTVGSNRT